VSPEPAFVRGKFRSESASVGARRSKKASMTVAA
jgi:hypothetical protein